MSKEKSQLQDQEFELLLAWLAPNSDLSAQTYLDFHKRTTALFINWHSCAPEDLADEALNRVARQLAKDKEIRTDNRFAYVHGIARNIRREHWRNCEICKQLQIKPNEPEKDEEKEYRLQCLDDCLDRLSAEDRSLLLEYYSEDKTLKIVTRDQTAARLGVSSGALRQRIWKLRSSLRDCVVTCVAR